MAEQKANQGEVIYQVSVAIDADGADEFDAWIPGHIEDLLAIPGFIDAELTKTEVPTKPTVVFVLGGPGAGKGTQCGLLVEECGFVHISAGDCLRAERNSGSADAELINQYIAEGKIVPVEITVSLLKKAMEESGKNLFLIDGFPRNANNLEGWIKVMGDSVNVAFCLFLNCPEAVMEARLLERGKTSGRVDDNVESIRKRFATYMQQTVPIINYFAATGQTREVNSDCAPEQVFEGVKEVVAPLVAAAAKPPRANYVMQYRLQSQQALDTYYAEYAPAMRGDGAWMAGRATISRTVLSSVQKFTKAAAAAAPAAPAAATDAPAAPAAAE